MGVKVKSEDLDFLRKQNFFSENENFAENFSSSSLSCDSRRVLFTKKLSLDAPEKNDFEVDES